MPRRIDLSAALRDHDPAPFPAAVPAFVYEDATPAHRFTRVVAEADGGDRFVIALARGAFDPGLARALVEFAAANAGAWGVERDVTILEGFRAAKVGFDSVLVLGPRVHELFTGEDDALNDRSVLAVPIYRSEFVGDETPDLIEVVRRNYVSTLDWKRAPSPRAYLRFHDTATGVRSTGRKPGIERPEAVKEIVGELTDAKGSFAEVGNYLHQSRRITVADKGYVVAGGPGGEVRVARREIGAWLDRFFMAGDPPA